MSIRFAEIVALEGLVASMGLVGAAYDHAAAETVTVPYTYEAVQKGYRSRRAR